MTSLRSTPSTFVSAREALERLQFAGVEMIPSAVDDDAPDPNAELFDLYTTRAILEEQAARLAAQHLTAHDLAALEALFLQLESASPKGSNAARRALEREFHFTIYRASKRRHILEFIEQLWDQSARALSKVGEAELLPEEQAESSYIFRSLLAACKQRDAHALGMMIRYELHQAAARLTSSERGDSPAEHQAAPPSRTRPRDPSTHAS